MTCRGIAATWIVAGGIWILGLAGLHVASQTGSGDAGAPGTYYALPGTASVYQDPSGRYTVVERAIRPVIRR